MKREPTEIERNSQIRILQLISEYCDGSQQVFADKVGIGKSSVSQYANGTNFPTNIRAAQIAKTFNVSPMWVMGFSVPMKDEVDLPFSDNEWSLSDDEAEIITLYRRFNSVGKTKVKDYINDLMISDKYIKTSSEMVSGE